MSRGTESGGFGRFLEEIFAPDDRFMVRLSDAYDLFVRYCKATYRLEVPKRTFVEWCRSEGYVIERYGNKNVMVVKNVVFRNDALGTSLPSKE